MTSSSWMKRTRCEEFCNEFRLQKKRMVVTSRKKRTELQLPREEDRSPYGLQKKKNGYLLSRCRKGLDLKTSYSEGDGTFIEEDKIRPYPRKGIDLQVYCREEDAIVGLLGRRGQSASKKNLATSTMKRTKLT